jgi:hypothetical protein
MINDYLRERAYIEFVRGSLIQGEFLDFEFFLLFSLVCRFPYLLLVLWLFPLLDDLLEFFLAFLVF